MNSEQKKFLDENGLKILWNQISMQDYPNNTALTSIINTLNTNKADKADIPNIDTTLSKSGAAADAKITGEAINNLKDLTQTQANWEQNDETAADFIKNRTHYKAQIDFTIIENKTVEFNRISEGDGTWTGTADIEIDKEMPVPIAKNHIITAIINNVEWTAPVEYNSNKDILHAKIYDAMAGSLDILFDQRNIEYPILRRISISHQGETPFDYNNFTLSLYMSGASVVQIPLEYIPVDQSLNHPISQQKATEMVDEVRDDIPRSYYDLNDIPCYVKESESIFLSDVYFSDNNRLKIIEDNWRMSQYTTFEINGQLYPRKQYHTDQYGEMRYYYCGNGALIDDTGIAELEDTGEDFVIYAFYEYSGCTAYYNGELDGEYILSLKGVIPEEVKELDERCIPDTIARVDMLSGDIFYVNITPTGENTATSDKTFAEITEAQNNGKIVKCKYAQYILPLCWLDDVQAIFGGATSNVTIGISIDPNNYVQVHTGTLAIESEVPTKEEFDALKKSVSAIDDTIGAGTPLVASAAVGQTIVVKAVDENGVPTEWEAVEMSGGDTLEFIKTVKLTEEVSTVKLNTDANGNPLNLKRVVVAVKTIGGTPNEDRSNYWVHPNSVNAGVIRVDVTQGVYAKDATVSSVVDIQMITDGVYLLNHSCNSTPKQTWGGYGSESTIKEINFGVSTEDYTFGVNTLFFVMGVKA